MWLHSLAVCYDNKMASKSDCFCIVLCNEDRRQFPGLSSCLNYALTNGVGVRELLVEKPVARELCDKARDHPPPTPQLGEEADYFRPSSTQSSSARRSASTNQLQLVNTNDHQGPELHLQYACVHGLPEALQLVLSNSPSIDLNSPIGQSATNEQGLTPLSWTALNNGAVIKPLISGGAGLDVRDGLGRSALHWAVVGGCSASVKTLLKLGADYSIADDNGFTPLHYACVFGLQEIVSSILRENTTQVNMPHQPTGSTPLMLACLQGHSLVVKSLLKSRASPLLTNDQGLTPLHCSVWSGESKCVKAVLASVGREGVDARDMYGRTPLHIAAFKAHVSIIQLLLKKGSSLSIVDNEGRTTLHWAILSQQMLCVECVMDLQGSALVNQPDSLGATPLHYAATGASNHLTQLLITKGGDATLIDASGQCPLFWACVCACDSNLRCLLSNQNEASSSTNQNGSALVAAASVGADRACEVIIEHDRNYVDVLSSDGYTALHLASKFGHTICVQCLLNADAIVDALGPIKNTSLHLACSGGHAESTAALLGSGADQTLPLPLLGADQTLPLQGQWPVHIVCSKGYSQVLKVLITHNATILDTPLAGDGPTPLHLAATGGHLDCCHLLVTSGCDKDTTLNNLEKHSALDLAMLAGHTGCADYLQSVGTPSSGGRYHRAAITIQCVWRFHRHKRRLRVRREWCAIVIQRSVREWLCWRVAVRVRAARRRHQHRAATIIQRRWRVFIRHKRRYEASCAQLRARLHQETLATTLILSQLHLNAQSISLPPPVPTRTTQHHGPSARYLLQASSNPAPIFPSGSLMFPAKPRTPLANRSLARRTHISRPYPRTRPMREKTYPTTRNTASGVKVQLPPVKCLPLTLAPDQQEMNRGSLITKKRSLLRLDISRESPSDQNIASTPSDVINQVEVIRSSPILVSSVDKLPAVPSQPSLVSTCGGDNHQQRSPKKSSIQLPSQAQLKLTRKSTFKDTPLKLSLISKLPKEDLELPIPPDTTSPECVVELTREDDESLPPLSDEVGVDSVVLNNIQRYDKLNQILSLLHVVKDEGCKGQEGEQLSHLKEQIMGALDEAVRLRADTQALTDKVQQSTHFKLR